MNLLYVPTCLGFPLLGGSKLGAHISAQSGLLSEAVSLRILLMEEPGFLLAMSNEGLKRRAVSKIRKYMKKEECEKKDQVGYPAIGNNDIMQDDPSLIQDIHHR